MLVCEKRRSLPTDFSHMCHTSTDPCASSAHSGCNTCDTLSSSACKTTQGCMWNSQSQTCGMFRRETHSQFDSKYNTSDLSDQETHANIPLTTLVETNKHNLDVSIHVSGLTLFKCAQQNGTLISICVLLLTHQTQNLPMNGMRFDNISSKI